MLGKFRLRFRTNPRPASTLVMGVVVENVLGLQSAVIHTGASCSYAVNHK